MSFTKIDRAKNEQDPSRDPELLAQNWLKRKTGLYVVWNLIDVGTEQDHVNRLNQL